jgi:hypothetical protein
MYYPFFLLFWRVVFLDVFSVQAIFLLVWYQPGQRLLPYYILYNPYERKCLTMDAFFNSLLEIVTPLVVTLAGALVTIGVKFINEKVKELQVKLEIDKSHLLAGALAQIAEGVVTSLEGMSEEFKEASADGKLTDEEIETLKLSARERINELLHLVIPSILRSQLVSQEAIDALIDDQIEVALSNLKAKLKAAKPLTNSKVLSLEDLSGGEA